MRLSLSGNGAAGARIAAAACLAPALLLWPALAAAVEHWQIDPAGSQVEFGVRLMLLRKLQGTIPEVEGQVRIDREAGQVDIDVALDARSLHMDNEGHADWARSDEFFDVARHPHVRFRAQGQPLQTFREGGPLRGQVTLRGATRPITLEVSPSDCERIGRDCAVRAHGTVERSRFGMRSRRLILSDRVELHFSIRLADPLPAAVAAP